MTATLAWVAVVWVWAWGCVAADGKEAGQLYSSLTHMEALFDFDGRVGELLLHLPEHLPSATSYLESYLSVRLDRSLGREVSDHPVHVFLALKRLVLYWPEIAPFLNTYIILGERPCMNLNDECENWAMRGNCCHYRGFMARYCAKACQACLQPGLLERIVGVVYEANNMVMPSEDDLRGAGHALARLQVHYRIPINSFMAGRIEDAPCSAKLTVEDCVRVAEATYHYGKYGDAWLWFDYCLEIAYMTDSHLQDEIKARQEEVEEQHDKNFVDNSTDFLPRPLRETKSQKPWDSAFSKLCRGVVEEKESDEERWRLRCHVSHRASPYLRLMPVRYEQVHTDPELYLFHDVITDAEIHLLKDIAKGKLERSATLSKTKNVTEDRVSHTAWLANTSHPVLRRLAHRIAEVTQLFAFEDCTERQAGEQLQILSYGIGGFYNNHNDVLYKFLPEDKWASANPKEYEAGDRLATWMFYLNDVRAGGRTAFPEAGIALTPQKGAAVLWFNMKRNGNFNPRTLHGGCPVLLGQKWVANRWIRENANFLRRPCSTDPLA